MFYHGLIKILVECHLTQVGDSWEKIIQRNNFSETPMQVNGSQELRSGFDLNSSFGICHNGSSHTLLHEEVFPRVTHSMSQKSSLDFDLVVANEIDKGQSDHLGQDHMTWSSSQTPAIKKYSIKDFSKTTDKRNDLKGKCQT
jgi:hypothetical protein